MDVELKFYGNPEEVPADFLGECMLLADRVASNLQFEDFWALLNILGIPPTSPRIPRLPSRLRGVFRVRAARSGSIILQGAVVAAAYYLIQQTLGETISDAWKNTETHRRLRDFLLGRLKDEPYRFASRFTARLQKRFGDESHSFKVDAAQEGRVVIDAYSTNSETHIETLNELVRRLKTEEQDNEERRRR